MDTARRGLRSLGVTCAAETAERCEVVVRCVGGKSRNTAEKAAAREVGGGGIPLELPFTPVDVTVASLSERKKSAVLQSSSKHH